MTNSLVLLQIAHFIELNSKINKQFIRHYVLLDMKWCTCHFVKWQTPFYVQGDD